MRAILFGLLLATMAMAVPSASADSVCVEDGPEWVHGCLETCTALGFCIADPRPPFDVRDLRDLIGPCTCDPVD